MTCLRRLIGSSYWITFTLPSHAGASERVGEIFKLPFSSTFCNFALLAALKQFPAVVVTVA